MSLAGVKQIVYIQNDFTAYKIGNIMYNLANRTAAKSARGKPIVDWQGKPVSTLPGAPIPIAASEIQLEEFKMLNDANLEFAKTIIAAKEANAKDPTNLETAFFVSENGERDFDPSITSVLCPDLAYQIFESGGNTLEELTLSPESRDWKFPNQPDHENIMTNQE